MAPRTENTVSKAILYSFCSLFFSALSISPPFLCDAVCKLVSVPLWLDLTCHQDALLRILLKYMRCFSKKNQTQTPSAASCSAFPQLICERVVFDIKRLRVATKNINRGLKCDKSIVFSVFSNSWGYSAGPTLGNSWRLRRLHVGSGGQILTEVTPAGFPSPCSSEYCIEKIALMQTQKLETKHNTLII